VSDGSQLFARDPNGDPLALRAGATNLAVRRDLIHGDLTATFSPSGITTTDSRAYDPFGAVIAATGTTNPALGYQAQWTDPATNKVDMQARWYDPAMGAFPSRDTWASPDLPSNAMNRMAYAGSNPLRYSDPSGHCFEVFSCALVGLAVGAVVIYVAVAPALEPGTNQQTPSTTPTTRYQPPAPTIPDEPFEDLPQAPTYRPAPVIAPPAVQTQTQVQAPKPTQKQNTTSNQTVVKKPVNNSNSQKQNTNNTTSQTHRTTVIQAPKPVEVPAANLIAGAPPAFSAWKNPLDVDPLAGVIIHQAVNQAVTYTPPGEGPQYVGDAAPESAPNVTGERRTILTTPPFDPGRATLPTPAISGSGLTVLRSVDDPMAPGDGSAAERRSPGQPVPAPKELDAFPDAQWAKPKTPVQGGGGLRPRWKDSDGRIYEWDRQHGTVEVYNKRGRHLGEFDPKTGEQVKPNDPGRRIEP
jgi:RHS repeat-associated protein